MTVEKIDVPVEKLDGQAQEDLFLAIVRGKDATETLKTSRGDVKVKYPKPKDLEAIARITANRLAGIPASCFSGQSYSLMQQIAALDVVVLEGPEWYRLAKKDNPSFSWADVPSVSYIQEVYALAYNFRLKVQGLIDGDEEPDSGPVDDNATAADAGDTGAFEGLSG